MAEIHTIGKLAENKVRIFLEKNGLKLLVQNFRCGCGEIDLIMQEKDYIVFVEVRARTSANYGNAIETVTIAKQKKLLRTATFYLQKQQWFDKVPCRFDIVGVAGDQLEWIKNAF